MTTISLKLVNKQKEKQNKILQKRRVVKYNFTKDKGLTNKSDSFVFYFNLLTKSEILFIIISSDFFVLIFVLGV